VAKFPFGPTGAVTMKIIRPRRLARPKTTTGGTPPLKVASGEDIGLGPWSYQGKKASRPEYLVLLTLMRLGWHPDFQTNFAGGRTIPGGQVLDIIVNEHVPPIYIDVRGFYHFGAAKNFNDLLKEMAVKAALPETKMVVVWESEVDQYRYLENLLEREVGRRGRG
jgi:hypothetical protein